MNGCDHSGRKAVRSFVFVLAARFRPAATQISGR